MRRFKPGDRVRVGFGAGCDTGRTGTIVPKHIVPLNDRGVPDIGEGNYKPMQSNEYAIRDDSGRLFTMFSRYLDRIEG